MNCRVIEGKVTIMAKAEASVKKLAVMIDRGELHQCSVDRNRLVTGRNL
jgi:hypothetical protein